MLPHGFEALHDGEGWMNVPGTEGRIETRVITNSLDPALGRGVRIQAIRIAAGAELPEAEASASDYWQEFILVEGAIIIGGTRYAAPARTTIAHGMRLPAAHCPEGCLLMEIAHF